MYENLDASEQAPLQFHGSSFILPLEVGEGQSHH